MKNLTESMRSLLNLLEDDDSHLEELTRATVERYLDLDNLHWPDEIYDQAYSIGYSKLIDDGIEKSKAAKIASKIAMMYSHP